MSEGMHAPLASAPQEAYPGQYSQMPPPPPQGYGPPPGGQQYAPQQPQQPYAYPPGQHPAPHGHQHTAYPQQQQYAQVHVPVYQPNVGPCAAGGGHSIKEEFTACGLVCGILLFPVGLICCMTMKDRTCMRCGMKFD